MKRYLVLICVGVALVVLVVALMFMGELRAYRNSLRTKAELANELAQLQPPEQATFVHQGSMMSASGVHVSNSYQTDLTYDQVRAHYDKELAKHGWTFRSHEALKYWGKDLGASETYYCRGTLSANLFWAGSKPDKLNIRYELGLRAGTNHCG